MRRYPIFVLLLLSFVWVTALFTGCEKWLDIAPKGKLIPKTVDDFDQMLNADELCKLSYSQALYLTDEVFLPAEVDDVGLGVKGISGMPEGRMYSYETGNYYTESDDDSYYAAAYRRIYSYNVIAENVMQASGDAQRARSLRAEALCGRAMEYLLLINLYAPHYDAGTASASYGVPLVLGTDLEKEQLPKASVAEVYAQVEKDLREALQDLPGTPAHGTPLRFSRLAAKAYLAKAAFLKGEWANALGLCDEVLAERNGLHDWTKNQMQEPTLLYTDFPNVLDNEENILLRYPDYAYGLSGFTYCPPSLLSLYDQTNDMRYAFQFSDSYEGIPLSDPSKRFYASLLIFSSGIGIGDVYLMAAECKVRLGDAQGGMDLVNALRDSRIVSNTPLTASSREEALRLVLEERRRELYNHSVERLIDIKRLAKEASTRVEVRHELPGGVTVEVDGNDSRLVLPVPPSVLRFNRAMKMRG